MCGKSYVMAYLWYTGKLNGTYFSEEEINEIEKRFDEKRDKLMFIFPKC